MSTKRRVIPRGYLADYLIDELLTAKISKDGGGAAKAVTTIMTCAKIIRRVEIESASHRDTVRTQLKDAVTRLGGEKHKRFNRLERSQIWGALDALKEQDADRTGRPASEPVRSARFDSIEAQQT